MKKVKMIVLIVTVLIFSSSMAFSNGLNLNSLGTRALAMGGAFVGLADDFSTIYWNPAGIAQFKQKYFGFYGTDIIPSGKYKLEITSPIGPLTLVNTKLPTKHYLVGMAAYYHPISENLVAGLGVYVPAGLGARWEGADLVNISGGSNLDWKSKIALITFAPAIAYKVSEQFYIGATLNINYGVFDIDTYAGTQEIPIPVHPFTMEYDLGQQSVSMSGWGYGATFGVLVKPSESFSLGVTFRTPSKIKFSGDTSIEGFAGLGLNTTSETKTDVTFPFWLAGGVAFKPVENLILTADVQFTKWSEIEVIGLTFTDPVWAAGGGEEIPMHWSSKSQIRFGAEYKINSLAIRGGYYWDPAPAPDRTMNILLPNYDFNVVTFGLGYSLNGLQLDFAVEYLKGKERDIDFLRVQTDPDWEEAMPGVYYMNIFVPNISISYRW